MIKHYLLNLNPQSKSEWDSCILRNPITGERTDLTAEIAQAVGEREGAYLLKVNLEVEILEHNSVKTSHKVELTTLKNQAKLAG